MAALLIKNLPADVHVWLKQEAQRNRRSMTQQVIVLFEERMKKFKPVHFGAPVKTRTPLTNEFIDMAKKKGARDCSGLERAVCAQCDRHSHAAC